MLTPLVGALVRAVAAPAAGPAPRSVSGEGSPSESGAVSEPVGAAAALAGDDDGLADSLQTAMGAELRIVEAVERAKAGLDAQALLALARMKSLAESMVAAAPLESRAVPFDPDELVVLEAATATGLSQGELGVRTELATGPAARFRRLRELLASGAISLRRACEVVEQTRHLAHEAVEDLIESVFAPTRDGAGLSGVLFRQRLRRAVLRADADAAAAAARRRAARRRNGARAQVFDDGTGELVVRNDADKIAAAIERADAAARAAKAAGDPRSLDQLRADFVTGAASYGQPCAVVGGCGSRTGAPDSAGPPDVASPRSDLSPDVASPRSDVSPDPVSPDPVSHDPASPDRCPPDPEVSPEAGDGGSDSARRHGTDCGGDTWGAQGARSCGFLPDWYASFGHRPPAKVWIVVPITTALGLDNGPCQLPGHGWVAAEQARAIMTAPGSAWQTLLAELDTGAALSLSHRGYRPSAAMVEHVIAVDGVCRGPGCTVPASRCDLDHDTRYPDGPTDVSNLTAKHRQHHRIRTAGFWRAVRDPRDAQVAWRTSAGRRYVTYPIDWLDDVRPRRKFGGYDYNPEPVTRPYGPAPDPKRGRGREPHTPSEPPPF